jgi:hypothetical protein
MNGLANWERLIKALSVCAALVFLLALWRTHKDFVPTSYSFTLKSLAQVFTDFRSISAALGSAVTITTLLFWIFTRWLWRLTLFRKLGVINFPDITGTWWSTSYPGQWGSFNTVVSIDHSFYRIRVTLIRNQSLGRSVTAALERTDGQTVRLYVIYYSRFAEYRSITEIPSVDHGENHSGVLSLDLNDEEETKNWMFHGEYWTNKRRDVNDSKSKGTWGRVSFQFRRRKPAPVSVISLDAVDRKFLCPTRPDASSL